MSYDPSNELYELNKKIRKKQDEMTEAFQKMDEDKYKKLGKDLGRLERLRKALEKEIKKFQGPA